MTKKKVCVITCYKYPNYVRGEVIRSAINNDPEYELISVKNSNKGSLRYAEIIYKLIKTRIQYRPDLYILTFRGYEILPITRLLTIGRPLLFDEFINLIEWTVYEHKKIGEKNFLAKFLKIFYKAILRSVRGILTDTKIHANYSSRLMDIPKEKYFVIPVGADEKIFYPNQTARKNKDIFEVFYYGNMLPLHGIEYVCDAALMLKINKNIHFTLIGGKSGVEAKIDRYKRLGANITYHNAVSLQKLAEFIHSSDLCLGGPFGNTVQSKMVITGKTYQFLACRKPVLLGETKEKTKFIDKENALIVKQASSKELEEQIYWAYRNQEKLKLIADNGLKTYQEFYSNSKISKLISKIIMNV